MGKKRAVVNGQAIASHGMKVAAVDPRRCSEWSATREGELPEKVDLRPHMTAVEDQANSNSCCANAVVGAYEYLLNRAAGDSRDISRLFVYYVGRKRDQVIFEEGNKRPKDEGMSIVGAIEAMQMKGACPAELHPFDLENVNAAPAPECFDAAMDCKVSDAKKVPVELDAMRGCLAEGYPIVFGLKLTQAFFRPPPSGRIKTPNADDPQSADHGLHAMLLVGYNDRKACFIVRNSWGEGWGVGGYAYLPYDYAASPTFNVCSQYAIRGLSDGEADLTPDDDDGEDPDVDFDDDDDEVDVQVEEDEDEEDEDDDFDAEDAFSPLAEARRAFSRFDADGSGYMDKAEVARALRLIGIVLTAAQLQEVMETFDADGSGQLSFAEFCTMVGVEPPAQD